VSEYCRKALIATATLWIAAGSVTGPGQVLAQQRTESGAVLRLDESVQSSASHHYLSPAERAKDDLLIAEVKSALAKDGVVDDHPVAVDCDHGKILLSGVIGSAAQAQRAGDIAAGVLGLVGGGARLGFACGPRTKEMDFKILTDKSGILAVIDSSSSAARTTSCLPCRITIQSRSMRARCSVTRGREAPTRFARLRWLRATRSSVPRESAMPKSAHNSSSASPIRS
jgi:hypothetical protein